jgi:hypothetical protein
MKKILAILTLSATVISVGYSQGLVSTSSGSSTYAVSTNGVTKGPTFGLGPDPGGQAYDYVLLYSSSSTAAVAAGSSSGVVANWSIGPTESNGTGPGNIAGAQSAAMGAASTTYYIELVGWSTGLGTSFANIESELENDSTGVIGQYLGFSNVGQVTTAAAPSSGATIFSPTGISSGFVMQAVPVPEPSTIALGVMGAASLLALRRKKA